MRKNIIFVVLCAVLLLLFTSFSQGGRGNPPPLGGQPADSLQHQDQGDPWDHLQSPPVEEDENSDIITIIIDLDSFSLYVF